jgi:hypothetical protein
MAEYKEVFDFAAKVGCLEGYLYDRHNLEPSYFPNWVGNIERLYKALPQEAKADFRPQFQEVLKKICDHCNKLLGADDQITKRMTQMLAELEG